MSQLADKSEEKPSRLVSLKILVFLFFGGEFRGRTSSGLTFDARKSAGLLGAIQKFQRTWDVCFHLSQSTRVTNVTENPTNQPRKEFSFLPKNNFFISL